VRYKSVIFVPIDPEAKPKLKLKLKTGQWLTIDVLLVASKVNGLDTTNLLLNRASGNRSGDSTSTDSRASSSNESSLLDARGRSQLTGRATEGL
jgi:hypothetical protein